VHSNLEQLVVILEVFKCGIHLGKEGMIILKFILNIQFVNSSAIICDN